MKYGYPHCTAPGVVVVPQARQLHFEPNVCSRLLPSRRSARRATRRCETARPPRCPGTMGNRSDHNLSHQGGHICPHCPHSPWIQTSNICCSCCFDACGKPSQPEWSCMLQCRCSEIFTSLVTSSNWVAWKEAASRRIQWIQNSKQSTSWSRPSKHLPMKSFIDVLQLHGRSMSLPSASSDAVVDSFPFRFFRSCIFTFTIFNIQIQKDGRKPQEIARDVLANGRATMQWLTWWDRPRILKVCRRRQLQSCEVKGIWTGWHIVELFTQSNLPSGPSTSPADFIY